MYSSLLMLIMTLQKKNYIKFYLKNKNLRLGELKSVTYSDTASKELRPEADTLFPKCKAHFLSALPH